MFTVSDPPASTYSFAVTKPRKSRNDCANSVQNVSSSSSAADVVRPSTRRHSQTASDMRRPHLHIFRWEHHKTLELSLSLSLDSKSLKLFMPVGRESIKGGLLGRIVEKINKLSLSCCRGWDFIHSRVAATARAVERGTLVSGLDRVARRAERPLESKDPTRPAYEV